MNFKTYTIGAEKGFRNIKMTVNYPDAQRPKTVACITNTYSQPLIYITIDSTTLIQENPCIMERMLEICTLACESNDDKLSQRITVTKDFIEYFRKNEKRIKVEKGHPFV